jgi:transcriptional regulatory protein RtcR
VGAGRFREDLLARLEVWSFLLPGLKKRLEDLEPLLEQELLLRGQSMGRRLSFSREGRTQYLEFATGPEATWAGNLRDLSASVQRLGTLAPGGRIDGPTVTSELERLRSRWSRREVDPLENLLSAEVR